MLNTKRLLRLASWLTRPNRTCLVATPRKETNKEYVAGSTNHFRVAYNETNMKLKQENKYMIENARKWKRLKIHIPKKEWTSWFPNFLLITLKVVNCFLNPQFKILKFELEWWFWTSVLITLWSSWTSQGLFKALALGFNESLE